MIPTYIMDKIYNGYEVKDNLLTIKLINSIVPILIPSQPIIYKAFIDDEETLITSISVNNSKIYNRINVNDIVYLHTDYVWKFPKEFFIEVILKEKILTLKHIF